jgi:hypothetical protein
MLRPPSGPMMLPLTVATSNAPKVEEVDTQDTVLENKAQIELERKR